MANMFSNKNEKQIPKTLSECTHPDATATNLHIWSESLETWGKIFFWILIVYGIVTSIVVSNALDSVISGIPSLFNVTLFITSIVETALYAFLEYCAYHVLALLISSLALITQNTIISANVALYQASKNCSDSDSLEDTPTITPIFKDNENDSYCRNINHLNTTDDTWTCKNCGTKNNTNYGQCKKCGKFRK